MSLFRSRPRRGTRRAVAAVGALAAAAVTASMLSGAQAAPDDQADSTARQWADAPTRLVKVDAPTQSDRTRLVDLGLDVTGRADATGTEVVLHGARDTATLRRAGFDFTVVVPDLAASAAERIRRDRAYAAAVAESPLPSGSTRYRFNGQFNAEMRALHQEYPRLTKPLTMPFKSVEGRTVRGLEITTGAANVDDGKPVFLMMGTHHAREWPTGEHTLEYAYDLLQNFRSGDDPRAKRIVEGTRTIIVPVVNPDGFVVSRKADRLGDFSTYDYEMKRKNCSISEDTPEDEVGGTCADNPSGRLRGTDLNRNYPGFWGGPGASAAWDSDTYRGDAPNSEPETLNVRRLMSKRQVTTMISNHTYSNLVLRPPSIAATGRTPDEPQYAALGEKFTDANGYTNQASFQLYDTSGSVEDWSYWNTGGYGFTFEIGPNEFHPPYREGVVAEYLGLEPSAGAGEGGNREAYYQASLATLKNAMHSRIRGAAPEGFELTIEKSFISATSPIIDDSGDEGAQTYYRDRLSSTFDAPGGRFVWHTNPSTRPLVRGRWGREPVAPPQEGFDLVNPEGVPGERETEEVTFTIEAPPEADNGVAEVSIGWPGAADWDYTVEGPDGSVVAAAQTLDNPEVATIPDPVPGDYTVVIENYEGGNAEEDWTGEVSFAGPIPPSYTGLKEAWILTCSNERTGAVVSTREVVVDRGDAVDVGRVCSPAVAKARS